MPNSERPSLRMSTKPSKDAVMTHVLADHGVLRGLMNALVQASRSMLRDPKQRGVVQALLGQFFDEIQRHWAYEERFLQPILEEEGVESIELFEDHEADRAAIESLLEMVSESSGRSSSDVNDAIGEFARRFEEDVTREELGVDRSNDRPSTLSVG